MSCRNERLEMFRWSTISFYCCILVYFFFTFRKKIFQPLLRSHLFHLANNCCYDLKASRYRLGPCMYQFINKHQNTDHIMHYESNEMKTLREDGQLQSQDTVFKCPLLIAAPNFLYARTKSSLSVFQRNRSTACKCQKILITSTFVQTTEVYHNRTELMIKTVHVWYIFAYYIADFLLYKMHQNVSQT